MTSRKIRELLRKSARRRGCIVGFDHQQIATPTPPEDPRALCVRFDPKRHIEP